jgi:hypothetical protein
MTASLNNISVEEKSLTGKPGPNGENLSELIARRKYVEFTAKYIFREDIFVLLVLYSNLK